MGTVPNQAFATAFSRGLGLGILSLGIICAVLLLLDLRVVRPQLNSDPGYWAGVVLRAGMAALVIAIIEELWYRGALQSAVSRIFSPASGIYLIAVFYALTHFLRPDPSLNTESVHWWSGFVALSSAIDRFPISGMYDSLAALFVAGVLLGLLRARQGHVAMCIGMHAGWVLVIKVYKKLTQLNPDAHWNILVGRYDGVLGWLAAGVLLLLTLWLCRVVVRGERPTA